LSCYTSRLFTVSIICALMVLPPLTSTLFPYTTLFRSGGSDYTASLIGAAIKAEEIQIWTDIDGFHNNDPRFVKHTRPIQSLSFRSEEHTSELQSRFDLVCRLLLEKKKTLILWYVRIKY